MKDRLSSLVLLYPYRCRKCGIRFTRFRIPSGSPKSDNKVGPGSKKRREILLYGIGVLLFLALLSFIVKERESPSDGG